MQPGSVKIVDRISAVEAIKRLGEDDLLFLNRLIVERLKLISQAKSTSIMANFSVGDLVSFRDADGQEIRGTVLRLNKKTVSIDSGDGHRWKVSPGFLRLEKAAGEGLEL